MKTLRKNDIESMARELAVLKNPEKILGGIDPVVTINGNYVGVGTTDCVLQAADIFSLLTATDTGSIDGD